MRKQHKIQIKLLNEGATIPTQGSGDAAGRDLYADLSGAADGGSLMIPPHTCVQIPLGFCTSMPEGWVGLVFPRSGISMKKGLRLANGVGVIDSDYRGEWKILLYNDTSVTQIIEHHERIAQVVFTKFKDVVFYPVTELDSTERGDGGFGSTGEK